MGDGAWNSALNLLVAFTYALYVLLVLLHGSLFLFYDTAVL